MISQTDKERIREAVRSEKTHLEDALNERLWIIVERLGFNSVEALVCARGEFFK